MRLPIQVDHLTAPNRPNATGFATTSGAATRAVGCGRMGIELLEHTADAVRGRAGPPGGDASH